MNGLENYGNKGRGARDIPEILNLRMNTNQELNTKGTSAILKS
jgi:hypothetical protein